MNYLQLKIHHFGFATKNIIKSKEKFELLGFKSGSLIFDKIQQVNILFLSKDDHYKIELIEGINENSPVNNIISKVGNSLYHICYEVPNIEEAIKHLRTQSFIVRQEPVTAVALNNKKIAWLYNPHMGLIELVEE